MAIFGCAWLACATTTWHKETYPLAGNNGYSRANKMAPSCQLANHCAGSWRNCVIDEAWVQYGWIFAKLFFFRSSRDVHDHAKGTRLILNHLDHTSLVVIRGGEWSFKSMGLAQFPSNFTSLVVLIFLSKLSRSLAGSLGFLASLKVPLCFFYLYGYKWRLNVSESELLELAFKILWSLSLPCLRSATEGPGEPPPPWFWVKRKKSQKEERPAEQSKQNRAPLSSRSGSTTEKSKCLRLARKNATLVFTIYLLFYRLAHSPKRVIL